MRIAVDIMGGDLGPEEIVKGVKQSALNHPRRQYILVGTQEALGSLKGLPENISTFEAGSVMAMDEAIDNLISKKDSSIWLATKLVKEGEAQAVVSAGSTGAQMASALLLFGRIKGINRPAIISFLPTPNGPKLFLDLGANTACNSEMLYQFAVMGDAYARILMEIEKPKIALLSNGSEPHKGTETVLEAYSLLQASGLNFIGNKEGKDLFKGNYDVMVTDGFSGNIALKTIEGTASIIMNNLKEELTRSFTRKLGAALIKPGLKRIKEMMDPNEYGGAPLVGVKGLSIICHGSSNAKAVDSAIKVAADCIERNFIGEMSRAIGEIKSNPGNQENQAEKE